MTYRVFPPPPSLRSFVRFFWVFESEPTGSEPYVYRSMADGCAELVFHYWGEFDEVNADGSRVVGPTSLVHAQGPMYRRFATDTSFGVFGAHLYPFAVPCAIRQSATDMCGRLLDLETVFGAAGRELEERVMMAPHTAARIELVSRFLEAYLLNKTQKDTAVLSGITRLLEGAGALPVAKLAADACLSVRQFERKVKEYVGLSPKMLSRIARFQRAAAQYGGSGKRSLTEIGLDCGYYDQSHFIRDFAEFSGYNPREFFAGGAEGTEYRAA